MFNQRMKEVWDIYEKYSNTSVKNAKIEAADFSNDIKDNLTLFFFPVAVAIFSSFFIIKANTPLLLFHNIAIFVNIYLIFSGYTILKKRIQGKKVKKNSIVFLSYIFIFLFIYSLYAIKGFSGDDVNLTFFYLSVLIQILFFLPFHIYIFIFVKDIDMRYLINIIFYFFIISYMYSALLLFIVFDMPDYIITFQYIVSSFLGTFYMYIIYNLDHITKIIYKILSEIRESPDSYYEQTSKDLSR